MVVIWVIHRQTAVWDNGHGPHCHTEGYKEFKMSKAFGFAGPRREISWLLPAHWYPQLCSLAISVFVFIQLGFHCYFVQESRKQEGRTIKVFKHMFHLRRLCVSRQLVESETS